MDFFMRCIQAPCDHIAVENPVGIMNTAFRKPDQIIEPYMFAESVNDKENYVTKKTCLWLKNLPLLTGNDLPKPNNAEIFGRLSSGKAKNFEDSHCVGFKHSGDNDETARSRTFSGIARAMAEQWG